MERTDRCTYLGVEPREMLGTYKGITSLFKQKRDYLNKVFADPDDDDVDGGGAENSHPSSHSGEPRVIARIARTMGVDGAEHMTATTVPLKISEGSKKDYFEEEIEKEHLETYYLGPDL